MSRMKTYKDKRVAIDFVDELFREQFCKLHNYCHEHLRSNPNNTFM